MIRYRDLRKGARLFYIKQLNLIQFRTSVWPVAYNVRRKFAKSACYLQRVVPSLCPSVRPSLYVYRLKSRWTNLREFWYWRLLWKSVEKSQIWSK